MPNRDIVDPSRREPTDDVKAPSMNNFESSPSLFEHGSAWVRADFHMHTLADKEFSYSRPRNYFVSDYVAALKSAGITVAVITNHNKFDLDEFKTLAKVARKEEIFLLPGIELSVKDGSNGIHMLAVFRDEWTSNKENVNYVQSFLNVTFSGQANFENKNGRSNHDLNDTIRELDKFERDYFLICAHVEGDNGLWGGLREGGLPNWGSRNCFRSDALASRRSRPMTSEPR